MTKFQYTVKSKINAIQAVPYNKNE
ncbi:hypothetical protein IBTHAUMO2_790020 [Nitrosopumilaceae archaeon]|nr:hypothetical protein IBTHAUMO2_790020 [Nitrosopumilaceae archaeon]